MIYWYQPIQLVTDNKADDPFIHIIHRIEKHFLRIDMKESMDSALVWYLE